MTGAAELVLISGPRAGRTVRLDREILFLGRDPRNDLVIDHPQVSRRHVIVTRGEDGWLIEDLNSTNGTFINQTRLTAPRTLSAGDTLGLGEAVTLTYREPTAPRDEAPPVAGDRPPPERPSRDPARPRRAAPARPAPARPNPASPETAARHQAAPQRDRTWLWLGIGCAILVLILACAAILALDRLSLLPGVFYEPLFWLTGGP